MTTGAIIILLSLESYFSLKIYFYRRHLDIVHEVRPFIWLEEWANIQFCLRQITLVSKILDIVYGRGEMRMLRGMKDVGWWMWGWMRELFDGEVGGEFIGWLS